jgi:hypothetical protein
VCTLVSALKFISYCNLILLEYVWMNSESNSWPIILSTLKAIFTNLYGNSIVSRCLNVKIYGVFFNLFGRESFSYIKTNTNSMFSNVCSFHSMAFLWGSMQPATQRAWSGPLAVLVNNVSLRHSHIQSFSIVSGCFHTVQWSWVPVTKISQTARSRMPNMCLFREKVCQPLLR